MQMCLLCWTPETNGERGRINSALRSILYCTRPPYSMQQHFDAYHGYSPKLARVKAFRTEVFASLSELRMMAPLCWGARNARGPTGVALLICTLTAAAWAGRSMLASRHSKEAVVILGDFSVRMGLAATLHSVQSSFAISTETPVYVGIDGDVEPVQRYLTCLDVPLRGVVLRDLRPFVGKLAFVRSGPHGYLKAPSNFARFFLTRIFPELSRSFIWYLDTDTVVRGSLLPPLQALRTSGKALAASYRNRTKREFFNSAIASVYREVQSSRFDLDATAWNAGVWAADLSQWERLDIAGRSLQWQALNEKHSLWDLGTQPLMHVLFPPEEVLLLGPEWNVDGIGYLPVPKERLESGHILHWSGLPSQKPWLPGTSGHDLWAQALPSWLEKDGTCTVVP